MTDAIAFLHTAQVHVPTFEQLTREIAPELEVRHLVREELLQEARANGIDSPKLAARVHDAMREAASDGAAYNCRSARVSASSRPSGPIRISVIAPHSEDHPTVVASPRVHDAGRSAPSLPGFRASRRSRRA